MHTPTRVIQVIVRGVNRQRVTVSGDAIPSDQAARVMLCGHGGLIHNRF